MQGMSVIPFQVAEIFDNVDIGYVILVNSY